MGMYTHLCLNAELLEGTPGGVVDTLKSMLAGEGVNHTELDHALFQTERWKWMLTSGGSYYFPNHTKSAMHLDDISKTYKLSINTNIKNYSSEWEKFLAWLTPHCERAEGYYRYEEDEELTPVLIENGKLLAGPT